MGRATLPVLLLLTLSLAHAASTPNTVAYESSLAHAASTPNTPPPARALSDAQVGGIVVGSLAFLCLGVCWCAWCTPTNNTSQSYAYWQCSDSCAGLGSACLV